MRAFASFRSVLPPLAWVGQAPKRSPRALCHSGWAHAVLVSIGSTSAWRSSQGALISMTFNVHSKPHIAASTCCIGSQLLQWFGCLCGMSCQQHWRTYVHCNWPTQLHVHSSTRHLQTACKVFCCWFWWNSHLLLSSAHLHFSSIAVSQDRLHSDLNTLVLHLVHVMPRLEKNNIADR